MTENEVEEIAKGDTKQLNAFMAIENNYTRQFFKKGESLSEIYSISPKLKKLMENIKRLDYIDMQTHGRLYKHYIYSRPKTHNMGITLVEAVFELLKAENYNVLDSSKIDSKVVLRNFNSRPAKPAKPGDTPPPPPNVYGEQIRFIGLSDQYKEGIDLFDVKYAHIFEEPTFETNLQQVMGRGTRLCGQSGLKNPGEFPWNLHVFIYKLAIPRSMRNLYKLKNGTIFSLDYDYLSDFYNQFRIGNDDQIKRITDYAHYMSIDYGLTQNYIPLDTDIPNMQFTKIQILEPYQRTVLSKPFRPYEMDLSSIRRQEEEDKFLMSLYDRQDTLKAIDDIKNKKMVVYEPPKEMTQDEIVYMALIELRSQNMPDTEPHLEPDTEPSKDDRVMRKQLQLVTKSIPKDGIMDGVFSFIKSYKPVKKEGYGEIERFKIVNEKECTIKISKARDFSDNQVFADDRLISYPVIKGDKIHNICFLRSELLSLISDNDGKFTPEIMKELKNAMNELNVTDVIIDVEMSDDFISAVLTYNDPVFSKTSVEDSLLTLVLDMMISWMGHTNVDPSAGMFYKFLNIGSNALKALFRVPMQAMKWILKHPMLSSVTFMLVKLLKIVLCVFTSDIKENVINGIIVSMKEYVGNSAVAKAFLQLVKIICHCALSYVTEMLKGNPIGALTECLKQISFAGFNLSKYTTLIMDYVVNVLIWSLEKITGFDFSTLHLIIAVIRDPVGTLTKLVFGSLLEKILNYIKGDLDILVLSILLELIPYRFLFWVVDKLIDITSGVSRMLYIHKILKDLRKYMNGFKNVTSSCLRLLSWIMNTYKHHQIIWYIIREMKILFTETIPCLYGKIKGYVMRQYDPDYKDEFVDCCLSDIQLAIKYVLSVQFGSPDKFVGPIKPEFVGPIKPAEPSYFDRTKEFVGYKKFKPLGDFTPEAPTPTLGANFPTAKESAYLLNKSNGFSFGKNNTILPAQPVTSPKAKQSQSWAEYLDPTPMIFRGLGLDDDDGYIDKMIQNRFSRKKTSHAKFRSNGVRKLYGSRRQRIADGGKVVHGSRCVKKVVTKRKKSIQTKFNV